jgi:predicted PurR-regulated permease PerM
LSLLPKDVRPRLDEVLGKAGRAMRMWLIGQCLSSAIVFAFTVIALVPSGMPFPMLLAVQAGLLAFIPTLGPFVAGVVIMLAGLSSSIEMALYGVGVYVGIQVLESNLITPMVQERTVRLPPAVTLGSQLVMGALFVLIGLVIAVPIAAAGRVFINELYVKDALGGPDIPAPATPEAVKRGDWRRTARRI